MLPVFGTEKKYSLIYADPPWKYNDSRSHASTGAAVSAYKTMPVEEICELPVSSLAAENCALALWGTFPKLPEALKVIDAWGFEYLTVAFVWVKLRPKHYDTSYFHRYDIYSGLGHYTKANAEPVLLARRGLPLPRNANDVKQIIFAPRRRHSQKPDEARSELVRLFGYIPRIELFARGPSKSGFDVWGNESC
jgi:N6-adenosine-specific RNA methylase IME4